MDTRKLFYAASPGTAGNKNTLKVYKDTFTFFTKQKYIGAISRITKTKHKNNTEFFTEKKHNIFPETRDPAVWLRVHALDSRLSAHRAQEILRLRHRFGYFWIPLIFR